MVLVRMRKNKKAQFNIIIFAILGILIIIFAGYVIFKYTKKSGSFLKDFNVECDVMGETQQQFEYDINDAIDSEDYDYAVYMYEQYRACYPRSKPADAIVVKMQNVLLNEIKSLSKSEKSIDEIAETVLEYKSLIDEFSPNLWERKDTGNARGVIAACLFWEYVEKPRRNHLCMKALDDLKEISEQPYFNNVILNEDILNNIDNSNGYKGNTLKDIYNNIMPGIIKDDISKGICSDFVCEVGDSKCKGKKVFDVVDKKVCKIKDVKSKKCELIHVSGCSHQPGELKNCIYISEKGGKIIYKYIIKGFNDEKGELHILDCSQLSKCYGYLKEDYCKNNFCNLYNNFLL